MSTWDLSSDVFAGLEASPAPENNNSAGDDGAARAAPPFVSQTHAKRKRAFVERMKETLKRTCIAKIKAHYQSATHRRRKHAGGGAPAAIDAQSQRDMFESTVAQEIDNCRRDLDRVKQRAGSTQISSGHQSHHRQTQNPESLAAAGVWEQKTLNVDDAGGLSEEEPGDKVVESDDDDESLRPQPQTYEDPEQLDEETYVEIMQFLEENVLKELERQEMNLDLGGEAELQAHLQAIEAEEISAMEKLYDEDSTSANLLGNSLFAGLDAFDVLCPLCCERYVCQLAAGFSCKCGLRFPTKDTVMDLRQLKDLLGDCYSRHSDSGCSKRLCCQVEERFGATWLREYCADCGFVAVL